jgi:hypothetical protein
VENLSCKYQNDVIKQALFEISIVYNQLFSAFCIWVISWVPNPPKSQTQKLNKRDKRNFLTQIQMQKIQ